MRKAFEAPRRLVLPLFLFTLPLLFPLRATADEWKFDVVHLKNGNDIANCLIDEVTDNVIRIRRINRHPGRVVVIPETLKRSEVESMDRIPEDDRKQTEAHLTARAAERANWASLLKAIDPENRGQQHAEDLPLEPAPFGKGMGLSYRSTHFRLVSNAPENLVYLTAVQLEQIYTAYKDRLPPRVQTAKPTTVLLPQSAADYQAILKQQGLALLNAAYYDAAHNQIVCPSELQALSDRWAALYKENQATLDRLDQQEAELNKKFQGRPPADRIRAINVERTLARQTRERNRTECEAALKKLFHPLYHEAFHAYLANFVYPPERAEVPRWLNEGLAQIFETAELEAGEMYIERPDRDRLTRAQQLLGRGELVRVEALLRSGPRQFLAVHNSDRATADAYYLTSWAMAWYLTFDRKLLGTKQLDDYVTSLHDGVPAPKAFEKLVGQRTGEFEEQFHDYLRRLQPSGRLRGRR